MKLVYPNKLSNNFKFISINKLYMSYLACNTQNCSN